jgi:hypothetical protein
VVDRFQHSTERPARLPSVLYTYNLFVLENKYYASHVALPTCHKPASNNRQEKGDSRQQIADSRQQAADSRQQAVDSRQEGPARRPPSPSCAT